MNEVNELFTKENVEKIVVPQVVKDDLLSIIEEKLKRAGFYYLHSLKFILVIFCSFPHARRYEQCIQQLSAYINIINKIQYYSNANKILHFLVSIFKKNF